MATRSPTPFLRTLLAVTCLAACGSPVESSPAPDPAEPAAYECTPDGYVLPGAQPGDVYSACGPERVQTTVTSYGTIAGYWDRPCLAIEVMSVESGADALVVDLRGAGGRSICVDTFTRVTE